MEGYQKIYLLLEASGNPPLLSGRESVYQLVQRKSHISIFTIFCLVCQFRSTYSFNKCWRAIPSLHLGHPRYQTSTYLSSSFICLGSHTYVHIYIYTHIYLQVVCHYFTKMVTVTLFHAFLTRQWKSLQVSWYGFHYFFLVAKWYFLV